VSSFGWTALGGECVAVDGCLFAGLRSVTGCQLTIVCGATQFDAKDSRYVLEGRMCGG